MGVIFISKVGFENKMQQSGGLLLDAGSTASTPKFPQRGNVTNPSCSASVCGKILSFSEAVSITMDEKETGL